MSASTCSIADARAVLWLFLIPVGGGIPSGVLLAKSAGMNWPLTAVLYGLSDVVLACLFEPIMLLAVAAGGRSPMFKRLIEHYRASTARLSGRFGRKLGPLRLITLSFAIDPMTGRAAAKAMGHGFVSGWALAIAGDMLYFAVIACSVLMLNQVFDETATTLLALAAMFVVPALVRRVGALYQKWRRRPSRQALVAGQSAAAQPAEAPPPS